VSCRSVWLGAAVSLLQWAWPPPGRTRRTTGRIPLHLMMIVAPRFLVFGAHLWGAFSGVPGPWAVEGWVVVLAIWNIFLWLTPHRPRVDSNECLRLFLGCSGSLDLLSRSQLRLLLILSMVSSSCLLTRALGMKRTVATKYSHTFLARSRLTWLNSDTLQGAIHEMQYPLEECGR